AGPDQSGIILGSAVTLTGAASADPDASALSYRWAFLKKPSGSSSTLSSTSSVTPSFTADKEGMYIAQLIVNDTNTDSSPPDTVVIDVLPNRAPTAAAQSVNTD